MTTDSAGRILWSAADAEAATRGRTAGGWAATGVSIDSRSVEPGDLFVALQGPNFDGHDYVAAALEAGAAAALVSHVPKGVPATAPLLAVEDTFQAMQDLGRYARLRAKAKVIAVTGSVGKTTTKEALKICLEAQAPTYANVGSFNNHWGVPLSLARMAPDVDYGVFELGMNHAGEIGPLSRQVKPDVAIITTVEAVHLENFDGVEKIADAKSEIFEGMTPNGTAVLNRDNPYFARMLAAARTQGLFKIWTFGANEGADARLLDCSLHATSSAVTAIVRGERIQYCLALPGRHHVLNSLAVLLAVRAVGGDIGTAARALAQLAPVKGRGQRRRIQLARGTFTLIDESYNASPVAVEAALQVLARTDPGVGGRRIVVLGDMLELGDRGAHLHTTLAEPLKAAGVDTVYLCGPLMRRLWDRLPAALRGRYAETSDGLVEAVAETVKAGDVVMVKGSLGTKMAPIVKALLALDHRDEPAFAPSAAKSI